MKEQQEEAIKERDKDLGDNDYKNTEGNTFSNGVNNNSISGVINKESVDNQVDVPIDFNVYR